MIGKAPSVCERFEPDGIGDRVTGTYLTAPIVPSCVVPKWHSGYFSPCRTRIPNLRSLHSLEFLPTPLPNFPVPKTSTVIRQPQLSARLTRHGAMISEPKCPSFVKVGKIAADGLNWRMTPTALSRLFWRKRASTGNECS